MSASLKPFVSIVSEFLKALTKGHTYNIRRNSYLLFGVLWGIPVPLVTIGMGICYKNLPISVDRIISELFANPLQFFFLAHPLLFGVVFGAMGTVRDDKERQRLLFRKNLLEANVKLSEKNQKLEELDELKDNFLSMVSHELWSPLTTVQGYISFVKDEKAGPLSNQQKEILAITDEQVEHLSHLISELIDISKIEADKFEIKLECLNVKTTVDKVIESFRQQANDKNIILDNRLPKQISPILADRKRIVQILNNILGNAIKFSPPGTRVFVNSKEGDKTVEFSIVDEGIGIPADKLAKVFGKFYQVDSRSKRRYGGCGLGLAIAKSIIELHKGKIWVESELDKGSKFFFEIPKCTQEENKEVQE